MAWLLRALCLGLLAAGCGATPVPDAANSRAMVNLLGGMMGLLQRNLPSVQQQSEQQTKQLLQQTTRQRPLGATAGAAGIAAGPNSMASLPLPPPEDDGIQWTTLGAPAAQPNHTARTVSAANATNTTAATAMPAANATVGPSTGADPADSKLEQALLVVFFFLTLLFLIDCFGPELRRQCCGSGKSQELTKTDR